MELIANIDKEAAQQYKKDDEAQEEIDSDTEESDDEGQNTKLSLLEEKRK